MRKKGGFEKPQRLPAKSSSLLRQKRGNSFPVPNRAKSRRLRKAVIFPHSDLKSGSPSPNPAQPHFPGKYKGPLKTFRLLTVPPKCRSGFPYFGCGPDRFSTPCFWLFCGKPMAFSLRDHFPRRGKKHKTSFSRFCRPFCSKKRRRPLQNAQVPFRKIGISFPSSVTPVMDRSSVPIMKSS